MEFTRAIALATCLVCSSLTLAAADDRPNIIWIFTDDHAIDALSAYGGPLAELAPTPNLDRLAAEGVLFRESYVTNSICSPSRASVLTGLHSHASGLTTNWYDETGILNYDRVVTFPQILQEHGYTTAIYGKWHLRTQPQGFDDWAVLPGQGVYYDPAFRMPDPAAESGEQLVRLKGAHSTEAIMDKTLAYLDRVKDGDRPFMLMCQFKAPHREWQPSPENVEAFRDTVFPEPATLHDDYATRANPARDQRMTLLDHMSLGDDLKLPAYRKRAPRGPNEAGYLDHPYYEERAAGVEPEGLSDRELVRWKYQAYLRDYLATVRGVDQQIGRLLQYLRATGLAENTIVAYSSDQGFYLGEHGWYDKRFMYDESFRTPLIFSWPGKPAGLENSDLVQNIDIAPTLLSAAGVEVPEHMHGRDLAPLIEGHTPEDWRDYLYYHYYDHPGFHHVARHEGVADQRYKLIRFYGPDVDGGEAWEFYDRESDPDEIVNRYGDPAEAERIAAMKAELLRLKSAYGYEPDIAHYPEAHRDLGIGPRFPAEMDSGSD